MRLEMYALLACAWTGCNCGSRPMDAGPDASTDRSSRDSALDAATIDGSDGSREETDVAPDAFHWSGDGGCFPGGDVVDRSFDAGACGDGCTVAWPWLPTSIGGWSFGERSGEVEIGDQLAFRRIDLATGRATEPVRTADFCPECGFASLYVTDAATYRFTDQGPPGTIPTFKLYRFDRATGQRCVIYQFLGTGTAYETAPFSLQRLNGAWAFEKESHLWIINDGASDPFELDFSARLLVGHGDVLAFLRHDTISDLEGSLHISRPPFHTSTTVWSAPTQHLDFIDQDPANPDHIVFNVGPIGGICDSGADIYYYDASLPAPPRALTHNPITELQPLIRGDRVMYLDLADDADPNGCISDPHPGEAIVETSVAHGGRTVIRPATDALISFSADRVWFSYHGQTAYQLLAP